MKKQQFYCFIGPKASVSTGITGLSVKGNLAKIDSVSIKENKTTQKEAPTEVNYLKDVDLSKINLERK
jgi:hypothetical protein